MRTVSKHVSEKIGQPIVIDNRAGTGGAVGVAAVAASQPNGYTIGATAISTIIAVPLLNPSVAYNPATDRSEFYRQEALAQAIVRDSEFHSEAVRRFNAKEPALYQRDSQGRPKT